MKKTIEVTAKDIARAKAHRAKASWDVLMQCPVALAANRAFKVRHKASTGMTTLSMLKMHIPDILLPLKATKLINDFDHSKIDQDWPVNPITFDVEY